MASTKASPIKPRSRFTTLKPRAIAFLIFWHEIGLWLLAQRFGSIIPTAAKASILFNLGALRV